MPTPDASPRRSAVTRLLSAWGRGEPGAEGELIEVVYRELRDLASNLLRSERNNHTLSATAVVHEAYLRLSAIPDAKWDGRRQFFCAAATAMRRLLVDHGRKRRAKKRGGGEVRSVALENIAVRDGESVDVVALDDALERLAIESPRSARVVDLRYFGGLTVDETAEVLETSPRTVKNDWRAARLWLFRELKESAAGPDSS